MNAAIRAVTWSLVLALLAAGFAFLYLRTQDLDAPKRDAARSLLRELKEVDAAIDSDIIRARTGLIKDYDSIAGFQIRLGSIQAALSAQSAEAADAAVGDAHKRVSEALADKDGLIDQFKAQNAILLNSVRFISAATGEVKSQAREAAETSRAARAQMDALGDSVELLFLETLKLERGSDVESIKRARQLLAPLTERRGEYPPAVAQAIEVFANHLLVILAQKEREEALFGRMAKLSVAQNIDALASAFDAAFGRGSAEAGQYRYMLYGYSAFALMLLAFFFGRRGKVAVPA